MLTEQSGKQFCERIKSNVSVYKLWSLSRIQVFSKFPWVARPEMGPMQPLSPPLNNRAVHKPIIHKTARLKDFCFSKYLVYAYKMGIHILALKWAVFRKWPL